MNHWISPELVNLGTPGLSRAKVANDISESRTRHYGGTKKSYIKHYANKTVTGPS